MEILEIKSSHSLTMSIPGRRPEGAHTYQLNCSHFKSEYKNWQKKKASGSQLLGVMTLGFERIWVTEPECAEISTAILASHTPVTIG